MFDAIFKLTCNYPLSFVMNRPIPCFLLETKAPSQRSPLAYRYLPLPVLYPLTQSPKYWSPLGQMACPSPLQSLDEFPVFPSALVNWQGAPPSSSAIQVSILRIIDIKIDEAVKSKLSELKRLRAKNEANNLSISACSLEHPQQLNIYFLCDTFNYSALRIYRYGLQAQLKCLQPSLYHQIIQQLGAMSYKGINYGRILQDSPLLTLTTMNNNHPIFSINYEQINNSTINKNDIIVQTGAQEVGNDDCMCEIRFHVQEPKEDKQANEQMEGEEEHKQKESAAQKIYKLIVQKAKIGQFAGESIATLLDVNLAVPRGKYTIDFYQKSIRFHGMTFNYTIEYKNITKGFILPMTNQSQVSIVLQLNKDKPIYQGQTVYRYIVIQIKKEILVDIKTKVNPQLIEKAPHLKDLQQEYSGPQFQVFVDLLQATGNIGLIQPGNHFKSKQNQPCVKASVKAQPGWLYMLKQSLIFIPKPVLYFRIEDIQAVQFYRINAANKQFDLKITLREDKKSVEFLGIERGQLDSLVEYFRTRQVKVIMEQEPNKILAEADEDESQDEDFEADEESESESDSQAEDELGSQEQSSSKKKSKPKKKENKQQKQNKKGESEAKAEEKDE